MVALVAADAGAVRPCSAPGAGQLGSSRPLAPAGRAWQVSQGAAGSVVAACLGRRRRPFTAAAPAPDIKLDSVPAVAWAEAAISHATEVAPATALQQLDGLLPRLQAAACYTEKLSILLGESPVRQFLSATPAGAVVAKQLASLPPQQAYVLACLPAIGQQHVLSVLPQDGNAEAALEELAAVLVPVEDFYDSIGGVAGYQLQCFKLLAAQQQQHDGSPLFGEEQQGGVEFLVPHGLDLADPEQAAGAARAVARGIASQPCLAEIYPLGGAGDRLGLACEETGDSLPTAVLPFCGRSLLEALIRDLQAREYLHYRLTGQQHTTPVAVMTSAAKGNHWRVRQLFEAAGWFGRGQGAFLLFQQPLVPVVAAADGAWLLSGALQPVMKPGGHGVIWKLMLDCGVFDWLARQGRSAALVRQISNPMAGQDSTLLALAGAGAASGRAFGFASCERVVGAAEGMNVLLQQPLPSTSAAPGPSHAAHAANGPSHRRPSSPRHAYNITNVEYTEFERLGIEDRSAADGSPLSLFPANTNVLYVGLPQVERVVREGAAAGSTAVVLPGMILNTKKEACHVDVATGRERRAPAGRLECTMQNLADCFPAELPAPPTDAAAAEALPTFMVYGHRRRVTSSAKRRRAPGSNKIHQTPDGSFYDLQRNAAEMLALGGVVVPPVGSVDEYLSAGPGFIFVFHPALGPLWDVVAQKIRGGRLAPRCEVQLEVAEAALEEVQVQGSLLVVADAVMGHTVSDQDACCSHPSSTSTAHPKPPLHDPHHRLVYSQRCGRVLLRNVSVCNRGIDWASPHNVFWRHRVDRHEACRIVLHGSAEFEAENVTLQGDLTFEVPDGHRMKVTPGPGGELVVALEQVQGGPSWQWQYLLQPHGRVHLNMELQKLH